MQSSPQVQTRKSRSIHSETLLDQRKVHRCVTMGPLVVCLYSSAVGSLPKLDEQIVPLGLQGVFHNRQYEVFGLIVASRLGTTENHFYLLQPGPTDMIRMYDNKNGLRTLRQDHISGKFVITGVVILPCGSPKATLTTRELTKMAGAVEETRFATSGEKCIEISKSEGRTQWGRP